MSYPGAFVRWRTSRPVVADQPELVDGPRRVRRHQQQEQGIAEDERNERCQQQQQFGSVRAEPAGRRAARTKPVDGRHQEDAAELPGREFRAG